MSAIKTSSQCASAVGIAAAAVVVLASAPAARADGETFEFRVSNILSPAQPTATVELWAHFDRADFAFRSSDLEVIASEEGWSEPKAILPLPLILQEPGVVTGARVAGIEVSQFHDGLHPADPRNPIQVWEARFSVSDFAPRAISLATETSDFSVWLDSSTPFWESRMATFTEGAGEITVIPAPGAGLPLAAGILLAARRRRPAAVRAAG